MALCGGSSTVAAGRLKKTAHAAEQERPDVLKRRQAWFGGQTDLDTDRSRPRAARLHRRDLGEHERVAHPWPMSPRRAAAHAVPHGRWKTTTLVADLGARGVVAPWVLDGPINGDAFETCVRRVLAPELKHGAVVVMDNLSSHKRPEVQALIEAAGGRVLHLPPYSPDFNPIEKAFAKLQDPAAQDRRETVARYLTARRHHHPGRGFELLRKMRIRCRLIGL